MVVLFAVFVVKYLEGDRVAALSEADHDASVGINAVVIVIRFEGTEKDIVAVAVVGNHDVLVATAIVDGKTAHVVGVEFSDVLNRDVKYVGSNMW